MRTRYVIISALICFCCAGTVAVAQTQQTSNEGRKLVRKVDPRYPEIAKRMNLGGIVKVVATVAADGNVKKVEPLGGSPILVEAAESAVSQWKFAPGGESKETVELRFTP
ncbi:MAG: energy transducer TonB [Candidatus Sulfotelmatobacter sp.]